jgi:hypothetical protein
MHIARPSTGFYILESPEAVKLIASYAEQYPRLKQAWKDIKVRLAMTGHREGYAVKKSKLNGARIWVFDDPNVPDLPRVKVAYTILGEDLSIILVAIG